MKVSTCIVVYYHYEAEIPDEVSTDGVQAAMMADGDDPVWGRLDDVLCDDPRITYYVADVNSVVNQETGDPIYVHE